MSLDGSRRAVIGMISKTLFVRCRCYFNARPAGRNSVQLTNRLVHKVEPNSRVVTTGSAIVYDVGSFRFYSASKDDDAPKGYRNKMSPYIRSCLASVGRGNNDDTGFIVSFLGTGGGNPTTTRLTSATLLRLGGTSFLFDAGEGVQRQVAMSTASIGKITKIFITHMHADHILGLPGLLLSLRLSIKAALAVPSSKFQQQREEVEIYGPVGIYNYIATNLALTQSSFDDLRIIVYELVGGDEEAESGPRGKQWTGTSQNQNRSRYRDIFRDHYPEISNRCIIRSRLPRTQDGTWKIQTPKITNYDHTSPDDNISTGQRRQFFITAAEVKHLRGVQTFGFTIEEPEHPKTIDPKKATKLGLRPGPKYRHLKNGFPVMSDDGTREIQPESVIVGTNSKARKMAIVGDNYELSPSMARLCGGCDVLIHEATISEANASVAITRGHSSAEMAGAVAKAVNAKVLVLNHISPSVKADMEDLADRAENACEGASHVVVSNDFMELIVPRLGFDFDEKAENTTEDTI